MSDTRTSTSTKIEIKMPSLWKVILHNDDFTPMEFVTSVLMQVFNKSLDEAERVMLTVHHEGKAGLGPYTKEVAVTKSLLVKHYAEHFGHPLLATPQEA